MLLISIAQFIPHGHYYLWRYNLVVLHLISDLLIALVCYFISLSLIYFVRKRQDLPYSFIFILFGAFIVSCGTSHLMEIWTLWHPNYWISGIVKAITALISIYTVIEIYFVIPQVLKIPNPKQIELANNIKLANKKLQQEIEEHKQTEIALQQSQSTLISLYNSSPMMMGIIELIEGEDFIHIYDNLTTAAFFGLTPEAMQGKKASELDVFVKIRHQLIMACCQSETTLKPVKFESTENINQDQKHFSITVSKIPSVSLQKQRRFSYIIENISDRKQMEMVLQDREERFRLAFEYAPIGIALLSIEGYFLKANHSLSKIIGYSETELRSITFQDITHPDDLDVDLNFVSQILEGKINHYQMEKRYFHKLGHEVWILLSVSLVRDLQKQPKYFVAQIQDISKRKAVETKITKSLQEKLEEKEVLLKEIHHRVKNNLQVICSLLNLQSRCLKEEKFIKAFKETQNRVKSMALVHQQLYQTKNLSQIVLLDYVEQLIGNLFRAYSITSNIKYQTKIAPFNLDLDSAVSCGLIINEIISNALKYAFKSREKGMINIEAFPNAKNNLVLIIEDNGKGLNADFDLENSKSLGLKLVKNLTEELQGDFEIQSGSNWGTKFKFTFTRIGK